jgi:3-deoxy-D-manno-octulosonic-acid transferase
MLKIYQILTIILAPLVRIYLVRRMRRGKEDAGRFSERLGVAITARPEGRLIWLHGASVGEANSILPLIKLLSEKYLDANFLITTGTVTSARFLETRLPPKTIHQYVPVDVLPYVQRFLKHWQPNLAIFVESEIWPNLITQTAKLCPLVMVNGHISPDSFLRWQKNQPLAQEIFGAFALCLTQSQRDADYIKQLGASCVKYIGNIKYDAPAQEADEAKIKEISRQVGGRPLWVAASTHKHDGVLEEKIVADTHVALKEKYPDILTILVPRHPGRKDEILAALSPMGLNIKVRSQGGLVEGATDIYLADTLGELGIFYRLAKIAFVGGSLVKRGGHNPLEPARLGCAIIAGNYTFNFLDIMNAFVRKDAVVIVNNQQELTGAIINLLADEQKTSRLINAGLEVVQENTGVIEKVMAEIAPYMGKKNAA